MTVPPAWVFVLGSLAAWRLFRLFSTDDILDWPRDRFFPDNTGRRDFLDCPYCAGWWLSALGTLGYYLVSDKDTISYRTRIRTPSFANMQVVPTISRGHMIPDLLAILGSVDYVLADIDR